jgi:hypothetical protein
MRIFIISCVTLLFVFGCNQCLPLEKVSDRKNTFELKGALGSIEFVNVFEWSEPNNNFSNYVWCIKSRGWINGGRFRITVPEIPDGFVQVIPTPPEQFKLHTGKFYRIEVVYSSGPTCPGVSKWMAE